VVTVFLLLGIAALVLVVIELLRAIPLGR